MNFIQYDNLFSLNFLAFIFVLLVIFFISRELVCWYWKLNKIINLLEQIIENTKKEKEENKEDNTKKEEKK